MNFAPGKTRYILLSEADSKFLLHKAKGKVRIREDLTRETLHDNLQLHTEAGNGRETPTRSCSLH